MGLKKTSGIVIFIILWIYTVSGQITFIKYPKKLQLFGRNISTDSAIVSFEGLIYKKAANFTGIRGIIYRNNILRNTINIPLTFKNDSSSFSFSFPIFAELANYRFEVYGTNGTRDTLLRTVDSVVCGDAFIINGQSNAAASMSAGSSKDSRSPFIRVLGGGQPDGSDSTWRLGDGDGDEWSPGNTGQWGLRMARLIVDNEKIPVAIFNGARSGMPIQFFQRNDSKHLDLITNYGRLLQRVLSGRLSQNIRAVLWHQGEFNALADSNSLSIEGYKSVFHALMEDWLEDFPSIEKFYVFQIRNGCSCQVDSIIKIKEALRELANDSMVCTMSTSAETQEPGNCHFTYETGYRQFGENIYRLLKRDLYGISLPDINAPNVKFAELSNDGMIITLTMEDILDSLTWVRGSEADFEFYGSAPIVSSATCSANKVYLTLNTPSPGITALSYKGHQYTPEPMVLNRNGIGALHFYKFPLNTPRYRDSVSLVKILTMNNINLPIDSVSESSSEGRIITLNLSNRNITTVPGDIGYMDSITTIDLSYNKLTSLPDEITQLTPAKKLRVDYNYLCTIDDKVNAWINHYTGNRNWRTLQRYDSLHFCSNETIDTLYFSENSDTGPVLSYVRGKHLFLHLTNPAIIKSVTITKLNGKTIKRLNNVNHSAKINLEGISHSVYIIQIIQGNLRHSEKIFVN